MTTMTLDPMENYAAKHMGLVPARFAPCRKCGEQLDLNLLNELRRFQHDPQCEFAQ
jgi:hypothetical protein